MHPGTSSDAFSLQLVLSHKNRRCADFTEQHLRVSDRDYLGMGQEPAFSRYPSVSGRADGDGDVTRHGQAIVASCGARSPRNSKIRARSQATSSHFLPQSEKILSRFLLLFLLGEYPERSSGGARQPRRPTTLVSSRGDHLLLSDSANDRGTFRRARRKDTRVSLRWRGPLKDPQGRRSRESTDGPQERSKFSEASGSERRPSSDTSPG